jgi:hypothetical protein
MKWSAGPLKISITCKTSIMIDKEKKRRHKLATGDSTTDLAVVKG